MRYTNRNTSVKIINSGNAIARRNRGGGGGEERNLELTLKLAEHTVDGARAAAAAHADVELVSVLLVGHRERYFG